MRTARILALATALAVGGLPMAVEARWNGGRGGWGGRSYHGHHHHHRHGGYHGGHYGGGYHGGGYYGGGYYGGYYRPWLGAGIAGGLIGAGIFADAFVGPDVYYVNPPPVYYAPPVVYDAPSPYPPPASYETEDRRESNAYDEGYRAGRNAARESPYPDPPLQSKTKRR